jgi:hypothetical protein
MTVEAAHHYVTTAIGETNPTILAPQEIPEPHFQEQRRSQDYEYPLQQRIATEWANLFGEDFTTATNVAVFRDKVDQLKELVKDPEASREDVLRKLAYIKIGATSIATSYGREISDPVEKKLLKVIPEKYSPIVFTELRLQGVPISEIRARLKSLHERGVVCKPQGIEIPAEEEEARKSRNNLSGDIYQTLMDDWQRATYGTSLAEHDTIGVVLDETGELVDEFKVKNNKEDKGIDMTEDQINAITDDVKIELIIGEAADAVLSIDGYFSAEDEDVERWQNFALDRMIDTYGDLPKLRRMGVPTEVGMKYLRACRHSDDDDEGRPRPIYKDIPDIYHGPVFRITSKVPPVEDSSKEMLH